MYVSTFAYLVFFVGYPAGCAIKERQYEKRATWLFWLFVVTATANAVACLLSARP